MSQYGNDVEASGSLTAERSFDGKTLLSIQQAAVIAVGLRKKVYIGLRSDALPGTGLLHDPFDGSTADKFDALMRDPDKVGADTEIILLPGTFETRGWTWGGGRDYFSWRLRPGCKLRGCGIGVTTLKLVDALAGNHEHYVIYGRDLLNSPNNPLWNRTGAANEYYDDCEVSDLTIDCNFNGQSAAPNLALNGIWLSGNRTKVQRVRVIHFGNGTSIELFVIAFGMGITGEADIQDVLVEDCSLELCDYMNNPGANALTASGFAFMGDLVIGAPRIYNAVCRRCVADGKFSDGFIPYATSHPNYPTGRGPWFGIGLGAARYTVFEDNVVRNGITGFYGDTSHFKELTLRNNQCYNVINGIVAAMGASDPNGVRFTMERLLVEGNQIWLRQHSGLLEAYNRPFGIVAWDALDTSDLLIEEATVRRNHVALVDQNMDVANQAAFGITVRNASNAIIEDNLIRLPHVHNAFVPHGKASIELRKNARVQCRNNRRPEDNSIILPYDWNAGHFLADMEFEQHKAAILRMSRF